MYDLKSMEDIFIRGSIGFHISINDRYHLLTESEVITGKSEAEALMCYIHQSRGLRFSSNDRANQVNKSFINSKCPQESNIVR